MFNKRGLSPVIAVVLLIMVTVVAAGIIVGFVVPFVRDVGDSGRECFEISNKLSFENTGFNCFNETTDSAIITPGRTGFSVKVGDERIIGFGVSLLSEGDAKSFIIDKSTDPGVDGVRMLKGDFQATSLEIPLKGEVKTYVVKGIFERAEISPILESGNACDPTDNIKINQCNFLSINVSLIADL